MEQPAKVPGQDYDQAAYDCVQRPGDVYEEGVNLTTGKMYWVTCGPKAIIGSVKYMKN